MSVNIIGSVASNNSVLKSKLKNKLANLNIGHFNAQSMLPQRRSDKFDEIRNILSDKVLDIVGVSETWLKSYHTNAMISIPDFKVYRNDRFGRTGGGVACYISSRLKAKVIESSPAGSKMEYLFLEVALATCKILVGVIYRPEGDISDLDQVLTELVAQYENVVIVGDFNLNLLDSYIRSNTSSFFNDYGLSIHTNNLPTHFDTFHNSQSLLDFFLLSNPGAVEVSDQFWAPGISKHAFIFLSINLPVRDSTPSFVFRDFKSVKPESLLTDAFLCDLSCMYNTANIDEQVHILNANILSLFNHHVPLKNHTPTFKSYPWVTSDILVAKSNRDLAFSAYKSNPSHDNWKTYKVFRNHVTQLNRASKIAYGRRIFERVESSKDFWKKIKGLGILERRVEPDLPDINDINHAFANSCGTAPNSRVDHILPEDPNGFSFRTVSLDELFNSFRELKSNAVGLDDIPLRFLKLIFPAFSSHILYVINNILTASVFPSCWKMARITPIPKMSNPVEVSDFRPISILPCLSKLCEMVVKNQIMNFITSNERVGIFKNQSGFRRNHSTTTALLGITEKAGANISKRHATFLLLLDFSKAFDSIDHSILCKKLKEQFCFSSTACNLVYSYLCDRLQCVSMNGIKSNFLRVYNGVPQGSILGPLLFSMYINDLPSAVIHSDVHIFADDVQLTHSSDIEVINQGVNCINADLEHILQWSINNKLNLNPAKTQAMVIYMRSISEGLNPILLGGTIIPYTGCVKSLGLLISENLSWERHIGHVCKIIRLTLKKLYLVQHFLPWKSRLKLVKTLIVPHLYYASEIFSGCDAVCHTRLRTTFNAAVRFVYALGRRDHISHLVPTIIGNDLEAVLKYRVVVLLFKIIFNKCPVYLFENIIFGRSIRSKNIMIPCIRSLAHDRSFYVRATRMWNGLPSSLKSSVSVSRFKRECSEHFNFNFNSSLIQV